MFLHQFRSDFCCYPHQFPRDFYIDLHQFRSDFYYYPHQFRSDFPNPIPNWFELDKIYVYKFTFTKEIKKHQDF